jgi:hypothetical protein
LRAGVWHLNVLGIELRPVRLETVSCISAMTAAAPVLAAITIER